MRCSPPQPGSVPRNCSLVEIARLLQSIAKTWGVNGPHPQPGFASLAPEKVNATITPDLLFEAHSSVLDLVFYDAAQFPSDAAYVCRRTVSQKFRVLSLSGSQPVQCRSRPRAGRSPQAAPCRRGRSGPATRVAAALEREMLCAPRRRTPMDREPADARIHR